jgi:hypothetical protein
LKGRSSAESSSSVQVRKEAIKMKKLGVILFLLICGLILIVGNALASFIDIEGVMMEVPGPAAMLLLGSGLVGLSAIGRKKLVRK